jgi:putative transposase
MVLRVGCFPRVGAIHESPLRGFLTAIAHYSLQALNCDSDKLLSHLGICLTMNIDKNSHRRKLVRLRHYDYSQSGAYFITMCVQNRARLFGDIVDGEMQLNDAGRMIQSLWNELPAFYSGSEIDEFVIMPNHFHAIIILNECAGAIHESPLRMTVTERRNMAIPKMIGRFKMTSSKQLNQFRKTPGATVWQRNYWERVIRNDIELKAFREYIANNPLR